MAYKALLAITGAFGTVGGIAAVNRLVFHCLMDHGAEISYFSLMEADSSPFPYIQGAKPVCRSVFHSRKAAFVVSVSQALMHHRYDLIFCDHVNVASFLAPLRLIGMCKSIVWLHGIEVFPPRPSFEGRLGLTQAWRCLASSEFTRQAVLKQFPNKQVEVCEPALKLNREDLSSISWDTRAKEPLILQSINGGQQPLGSKFILHVGRMDSVDRYKGQDRLLAAFPKVHEIHSDSQLVLVGDGVDARRLRNISGSFAEEIQDCIFMPGYVSEHLLNRLYRSCYLFAMPSTGEGFGLVYLEAMAHARPCLGGGVDAASCVIRNNETGVIVENPRDLQAIADKIIELFDRPDMAKRMGQAGFDLVCSHYLYTHFRDRFEKIIATTVS